VNTRILDDYEALCRRGRAEAEAVAKVRELIAYELEREEEPCPPTQRSRPHVAPRSRPVFVAVVAA